MYALPPNIMRRPVEEPAREPATEPLEGTDREPVGEPWAENGTIIHWLATGINAPAYVEPRGDNHER